VARVASPQKRAEWMGRLRRFESSSATVVAFCAAEGVSMASFYQWRAKLLSERTRNAPSQVTEENIRNGSRSAAQPHHPTFVPVHIAATSEVAIHLPGGVRVMLPAHERELIERTIAMLVRATAAQERG
jgi:hypothetical protein